MSTDGSLERAPRIAFGDAAPAELRPDTSGFQAELNTYLHQRLKAATGVQFLIVLGTYLVSIGLKLAYEDEPMARLTDATDVIHLAGLVAMGILYNGYRCEKMTTRRARILDALTFFVVAGMLTGIYIAMYENGPHVLLAFLGMFTLAWAALVPNTWRRRLILSIPAPLVMIGYEIARGESFMGTGAPYPASSYQVAIGWHSAYLVASVALAAFVAKVTFSLRKRAYDVKRLDKYEIVAPLGQGSMGQVYRAKHALLRREVAIKLMRAEIVGASTITRFENEVQLTSKLTHPNTIQIYDYGQTADGIFYYVMELLNGADLAEIVGQHGALAPSRVLHLLKQACASLEEAHANGMIHRDIKASNLILCRRGLEYDVLKVMDFGLVKDLDAELQLTMQDEIVGSPHTVAPEMVRGEPVGPAADVYALGAVGCYLLMAKQIFPATSLVQLLRAQVDEEPIRPSTQVDGVPADLEAVLMRCLAKDPTERYADAGELRVALAECSGADDWSQDDAATWWKHVAMKECCWEEMSEPEKVAG